MRYIADSDGYVKEVSFGADIVCDGQVCTEYTGAVPTGYASLEAWFMEELEKLYRWKIVDGNLTLDSTAAAPSDKTPEEILASMGVADYIVERGTNNEWEYVKYANRTFRAKWYGQLAVGTGKSWCGQYYHSQTYAINVPSFATTYELVSAEKRDSLLAWYVGITKADTSFQTFWCNGTSGSMAGGTFGYVLFEIEGTW